MFSRLVGLGASGLVALSLQLAVAGPASAGPWVKQDAGATERLPGIACPSVSRCYAVSDLGYVYRTVDGGETWGRKAITDVPRNLTAISCVSESKCWIAADNARVYHTSDGGESWSLQPPPAGTTDILYGIDCPSATTCVASGTLGILMNTKDGGATWNRRSAGVVGTDVLNGAACWSASVCHVVGRNGDIVTSADGGDSWSRRTSGTFAELYDVACPVETKCWAVGAGGAIRTTAAGDQGGWTGQSSGTTAALGGISCAGALTCVAVGGGGEIRTTANGGVLWTGEDSGTSSYLEDVSCPTPATCWAVGANGTIVTNRPVSSCDESEVGVPPACLAGQTPPVPSDDCNADPQSVVIDGYVGSLYARLRTKQGGSETWVCTRLQPEGGAELLGGKFVAGAMLDPAVPDSNGGACAQQPGYNHVTGGTLDGQPYGLDTWVGDNDAWVCLIAAGTGARVRLSSGDGTLPFQQDPGVAPSPPRTPWTPGVASADCEMQVTGTKTQAVNAVFGGVQVWLTAWRSGSKIQLCVRAEQGSTAAGGRFTIDADPGVTPVLERGSDTNGCTRDVLTNDTTELAITRSENNANPASICVRQGTNVIRLTAGYTGTPNGNAVTWAKD